MHAMKYINACRIHLNFFIRYICLRARILTYLLICNSRPVTWPKFSPKLTFFVESCSVMSNSLWPHGLYSPWNSPGQNTGVGSLSLLQGIFSTQGLNPGLLHCRQILYQLSHKGSPRIPEWVAYTFSSGSSWPKNRTGVSCLPGRFFTNWTNREAPE